MRILPKHVEAYQGQLNWSLLLFDALSFPGQLVMVEQRLYLLQNPREKNHKLWGQEIWEAFCWRVAMFVIVAARRLVVGLAASREIIEN